MLKILLNLRSDVIDVSLIEKTEDKKKISKIQVLKEFRINPKEGFEALIGQIKKSHKGKIEEIFCVLSSSYAVSKTYLIKHEFEKPTLIKQTFLDELIRKNIRDKSLEKVILYTTINGYETKMPVGKEATLFEMTVFQSTTSPEVLQEIEQAFSVLTRKITYHTMPYLVFRSAKTLTTDVSTFIFLEIEKNNTTASLIHQNSDVESVSFLIGTSDVISTIQKSMNVDWEAAKTLLKMKNEKTLEQDIDSKLELASVQATFVWQKELSIALTKLSHGIVPSSLCYILGETELMVLYQNALQRDNWLIKPYSVPLYNLISF